MIMFRSVSLRDLFPSESSQDQRYEQHKQRVDRLRTTSITTYKHWY